MGFSMLIGGGTNLIDLTVNGDDAAAGNESWKYMTLILIMVYGAGFQVAWGSVPWIYPSEIFSQAEKDKCCTVSASLQYVANTVICAATPFLNTFAPYVLFWTFGVFNLIILVIVCKVIRETKGVPVEEIPDLFK